jgi:CheY-like chemotaxis protein
MERRIIMILEDNEDRIRDFEAAVASLGPDYRLRLWHDAPTMRAECLPVLPECCLISLDHDLHPMPGVTQDPGTGLEIAELLARQQPVCPVIIHTSNTERRWSMHNEFRFGHWSVEIVPPIGDGWIHQSWLPRVRALIAA